MLEKSFPHQAEPTITEQALSFKQDRFHTKEPLDPSTMGGLDSILAEQYSIDGVGSVIGRFAGVLFSRFDVRVAPALDASNEEAQLLFPTQETRAYVTGVRRGAQASPPIAILVPPPRLWTVDGEPLAAYREAKQLLIGQNTYQERVFRARFVSGTGLPLEQRIRSLSVTGGIPRTHYYFVRSIFEFLKRFSVQQERLMIRIVPKPEFNKAPASTSE